MTKQVHLDTSLSDLDTFRVESLCAQVGVPEAARKLGVGKDSLLRILAKQPLRRGTVALIRQALSQQPGQVEKKPEVET